ncbi:MAG: hypothetical protein ACHQ2Y_06200 [Candidatus Lutacidiplasmatales archaeon]
MDAEVLVGLDIPKNCVVAAAVIRPNHPIYKARFSSSDCELLAYLERIPGENHVGIEACSFWEQFYDAVLYAGTSVSLSHPKKTPIIAGATLKTDRVDREALATLFHLVAVPEAFAPPPPFRVLRGLVRKLVFYSAKEERVKNHFYSYLMRKGIEDEAGVPGLHKKREELREHRSLVLGLMKLLHEATNGLDKEIYSAARTPRRRSSSPRSPGWVRLSLCPLSPTSRPSNGSKIPTR